jgi:citronellyl-CoA dehydrogenase
MLITPEHEELRRTTRNFIEKEINPFVDQWEAAGIFPAKELFRKMGVLGLLGITKPEAYGGINLDYSYEVVFAEEMGSTLCGGIPMAVGVQTNMCTPALALHGSDELREEFLAPAISGDSIGSIAVSEPGAGSDVAGITTTAAKDGSDYIINGSKMWITNATQADFFCLLANTGNDHRHNNKSLIIVPAGAPGISVGPRLKKMGMRSSDTAAVYFDNVRVPQRYRIGEEGLGFTYQMEQFQEERLFAAAIVIKTLENCINSTIDYTRERIAYGKPLLDKQIIRFALTEMQTETEALRALVYQATETYVAGGNVTKLASMAKLKAGRLCRSVPEQCLQFWGGMGYMEESLVNRLCRDLRLVAIGGGADEVMQSIIAKKMGITPRQ